MTVPSSGTSLTFPASFSNSSSPAALDDVWVEDSFEELMPGPSEVHPLYSNNGNHCEIEKSIKLLIADPDCSIFDMPIMQLLSVLSSHSINTTEIRSTDQAIVQILDHIMNGKCFLSSCRGGACLTVRRGIRNGRSMAVLAAETVLMEVEDAARVRAVCFALGYTENDLSSMNRIEGMKSLVEMSRDNFSTCFNISDILCNLDQMSTGKLKVLCQIHSVDVTDLNSMRPTQWTDIVMSRLTRHFIAGECEVGVQSVKSDKFPKCKQTSQHNTFLKVVLLESMLDNGLSRRKKPLIKLLESLDVEYDATDTVNQLKSRLKKYTRRLRVAKEREVDSQRHMLRRLAERERVRETVDERLEEIRSNWPAEVSEHMREFLLNYFRVETCSKALQTRICAVCSESRFVSDFAPDPMPISDPNLNLELLRSRYPLGVDDPFETHETLRGIMLDRAGFVQYAEHEDALWTCRFCYRTLTKKVLPRCALANRMFLGEVPDCLKDLTVVEEAMIARRRAKCWIIHLNDVGAGVHTTDRGASHGARLPTTQRGMKGHIIVYPSNPQNIGSVLPPSMEETVTPMCVVFVGSTRPSPEWLSTKAKPLIIRREKVRAALLWLKEHNPLYSDVTINHQVLNELPEESVAPVQITMETPTESSEAVGSRHDNVSAEATDENGAEPESTFEKAVVADVDMTNIKSGEMYLAALRHLNKGGSYVQIPHAPDPCNEYEDFDLFPLLYPTLFPYGYGGFEHPQRKRHVGMKVHAQHLFSLADRRFQEHYSFLFTVFNILQRRIVSQKAKLKVSKSYFNEFAAQVRSISEEAIARVAVRFAKGDYTSAYDDEERLVLRLMKEVNLVSEPVPGSSASKLALRNQIRGMMTDLGLPSFYITINPADIYNPLVRFLAGDEIDVDNIVRDNRTNAWNQQMLIAKNPFVAGKFFDIYMRAFFKCLLGFDLKTKSCANGLFGITKGYFGCVEAQGRGSLHCHMLVWLEGALDPQEIRDRIVEGGDQAFAERLCHFIDESISNGLPPEPASIGENELHPCSVRGPMSPGEEGSAEEHEAYKQARESDIYRLVKSCQRHTHTHSCYKHWRGGDERKQCRFNLDESHHVERTTIDPITGEVEFRIQDGMVNNFCVTILRAIRSNMDIKFIGSGASAKAILYYITDYITKTQLKAHVAYQTMQAAVQKLERRNQSDDDFTLKAKRMLVKCANALISQQELSAPQVVSYLMGYGDHYTSHRFRNLFWKPLENHVAKQEGTPPPIADIDERDAEEVFDENDESENLLIVERDVDGALSQKGSQLLDYTLRGELFEEVCVYDFVAHVDKVKIQKKKRERRAEDAEGGTEDNEGEGEGEVEEEEEEEDGSRPFAAHVDNPRSLFSASHPEYKTHFLRRRKEVKRLVPVPVGPRIYRRDVPDMREDYCRLMLILFKPWRDVHQLKEQFPTWEAAFQSFCDQAEPRMLKVMENMQRLHECRDSRDEDYAKRRIRNRGSNSIADEFVVSTAHEGLSLDDVEDMTAAQEGALEQVENAQNSRSKADEREARDAAAAVTAAQEAGLFKESTDESLRVSVEELQQELQRIRLLQNAESTWRKDYKRHNDEAKKIMMSGGYAEVTEGPRASGVTGDIELGHLYSEAQVGGRPLSDVEMTLASLPVASSSVEGKELVEAICQEYTLNVEQAGAFREIAYHSLLPRNAQTEPLRMYLGGPGGTGKSRVLDALKTLFDRRNETRRLRVASYTGVAASNVAGVTLHAALQLSQIRSSKPGSNKAKSDLIDMWKGVDYLFIDEVSMVGAELLNDISHNLSVAKETSEDFGGISVVFAGDFCQLAPVQDTALYVPSTRTAHLASTSQTARGLAKTNGRGLWLQLKSAYLLKQQMRQSGESNTAFRDLLTRLRLGKCSKADVALLRSRVLENLPIEERACLGEKWAHTPIITAHNATKDALNMRAVQKFAMDRGLPVQYYHARDIYMGEPVTGRLQRTLLDLHSGKTQQLGRLPLVIGMPVVFTQNYDVAGGVVNGAEGILKAVRYETDDNGYRYATSCVVSMPQCSSSPLSFLEDKEVVALQETSSCKVTNFHSHAEFRFTRKQLPIMPAFAYTDYKAQGRTMSKVIVDLQSCRNLQSVYVMLSRATSLDGLLILRDFDSKQVCNPLNGDLRCELKRLDELALSTRAGTHVSSPTVNSTSSSTHALPSPLTSSPSRARKRRRSVGASAGDEPPSTRIHREVRGI